MRRSRKAKTQQRRLLPDFEAKIPLLSHEEELYLLGQHDRHVREVSKHWGVRLSSRGGELRLQGPDEAVERLVGKVEAVLTRMRAGKELMPMEVQRILLDKEVAPSPSKAGDFSGNAGGSLPSARTPRQADYLEALSKAELVLATGPAGTGKTYLAVAEAVRALQCGQVQRLVFTRPAVEAGENLGFLPGDLEEKIDPYLRPLFDSLNDLIGPRQARRMRDLEILEIAPLAFMRGRTLRQAFVILDEAQNATASQLKMFLTRLGEGTRAVVNGDISQTDLPKSKSGLADAIQRLEGIEGISVIRFHRSDIQRSRLVERIVEAYATDSSE